MYLLIALLCMHNNCFSQVGIGTTNPDPSSILHIQPSTDDKGLLIPRLTTGDRNTITTPANGLLIFNTTINNFEYNAGTPGTPVWTPFSASPTYIGKFIITGTGSQTISGLPFQPTSIKFSAHANVESYNINADNGIGNNNGTFQNAFGSMQGFATNYSGSIQEQVIYIGGSGNSINDISRYSSNSRSIGIRYSNQNGDSLGLTTARVTNFNSDGFTINVTNHTENIVVIYEAHR